MLQGLSCFAATIQHGSAVVGWQHGFGALQLVNSVWPFMCRCSKHRQKLWSKPAHYAMHLFGIRGLAVYAGGWLTASETICLCDLASSPTFFFLWNRAFRTSGTGCFAGWMFFVSSNSVRSLKITDH